MDIISVFCGFSLFLKKIKSIYFLIHYILTKVCPLFTSLTPSPPPLDPPLHFPSEKSKSPRFFSGKRGHPFTVCSHCKRDKKFCLRSLLKEHQSHSWGPHPENVIISPKLHPFLWLITLSDKILIEFSEITMSKTCYYYYFYSILRRTVKSKRSSYLARTFLCVLQDLNWYHFPRNHAFPKISGLCTYESVFHPYFYKQYYGP